MDFHAQDIVRVSTALMVAPLPICGLFWATSRVVDPMLEYPTRPMVQLLFALAMLPNSALITMWFFRSRTCALLLTAAMVSHTIRTYVTQADSRFLSGQAGIMGNLFIAGYMLKAAFFSPYRGGPRKVVASLYIAAQVLLMHSLGAMLQTGHSVAPGFYRVISILLAAYFNWLCQDIFHGEFVINWVKTYTV